MIQPRTGIGCVHRRLGRRVQPGVSPAGGWQPDRGFPRLSLVGADGRQFVFLPVQMSGLNVSRKFFVPTAAQGDSLGYMRIQEILSNPTGAPITVKVAVLWILVTRCGSAPHGHRAKIQK